LHKSDSTYPDFVIWLTASQEWVKERILKADLTEDERQDKHLSMEELDRRTKQYNEEISGLKEYFT